MNTHDVIEMKDETISLLQKEVERLEAELAYLKECNEIAKKIV